MIPHIWDHNEGPSGSGWLCHSDADIIRLVTSSPRHGCCSAQETGDRPNPAPIPLRNLFVLCIKRILVPVS
ncbi:hypothetical protein M8J76_001366 [Diaphorina citri]|nr:hypothetical protein M8J76_001366 [Diaphorina citri]